MALVGSISGCVDAMPQDVVEAVEHIDQDLVKLRAAEFSPTDYARFAHQWMVLKARAQADEDLIRWPWEPNELEVALRRLQAEGSRMSPVLRGNVNCFIVHQKTSSPRSSIDSRW